MSLHSDSTIEETTNTNKVIRFYKRGKNKTKTKKEHGNYQI